MNVPTFTTVSQELIESPQAPKSHAQCTNTLRWGSRFVAWLGRDVPIAELTQQVVDDYLRFLAANGMGKSTVAQHRAVIHRVWRFAKARDYCETRPVFRRSKRVVTPKHAPPPLRPWRSTPAQTDGDGKTLPTLTQYAEQFAEKRGFRKAYADRMNRRAWQFCQWYGEDILVRDFTGDLLDRYIEALQASTELAPAMIDAYRKDLRSLWIDAYKCGRNDFPPRPSMGRAPKRPGVVQKVGGLFRKLAACFG